MAVQRSCRGRYGGLIACLLLFVPGGCGGSGSAPPPPVVVLPPVSPAEYTGFGTPTAVRLVGYAGDAMEPFIAKDGKTLFFNNSNDPAVNTDLFYAVRIDDLDFQFLGPVGGTNGPSLDGVASLDSNGVFYFVSTRNYAASLSTLYSGPYAAGAVEAAAIVAGVSPQQPGVVNFDAEISGDGATLYFDDGRYTAGGVLQAATLVVADRRGAGFVRRPDSAVLLADVNTAGFNYAPAISSDGRELFFTRFDPCVAGSLPAIYRAVRAASGLPFGTVQKVAAATGHVEAPTLSADGHFLYYHKQVDGVFRLFRLQR